MNKKTLMYLAIGAAIGLALEDTLTNLGSGGGSKPVPVWNVWHQIARLVAPTPGT